jgi:hypothetical protein
VSFDSASVLAVQMDGVGIIRERRVAEEQGWRGRERVRKVGLPGRYALLDRSAQGR